MAFAQLIGSSLQTAGHGIATGVTALADEVTGRQIQALHHARHDQEHRMHSAARDTSQNARVVGNDMHRVISTTGVSAFALGQIVTDPQQLRRLIELIQTHDFPALVRALAPGAEFPSDFFPQWIQRAGGYFPKFAQVLSVRADLIRNPEVLRQLGRCIEEMPAQSVEQVRAHLHDSGWDAAVCQRIGRSLAAGSVAQVNMLALPDGTEAVVKVAWPDTQRKMQNDFRLFSHARRILDTLRLDDASARHVAAIFSAVERNETNVMREFDLHLEACSLDTMQTLCTGGGEWTAAYQHWLVQVDGALLAMPGPLGQLALQWTRFQLQSPDHRAAVRVPQPLPGYTSVSTLAMTLATGQSLHSMLTEGDATQQERAVACFLTLVIPFVGWLLLCKSTSHLAHADPHLGNFRWDDDRRTLWVLDWGSYVNLTDHRRRSLCLLISLIAGGGDDESVAEMTRSFGVNGVDDTQLAVLMRGMLNASAQRSAQDALGTAALENILDDVGDDVVPVVRCLATLGGILKKVQQEVNSQFHQGVELSLASLWAPFAEMGLLT